MKNLASFLAKAWLTVPLFILLASVVAIVSFLGSESLAFASLLVADPWGVFLNVSWFPSEGQYGLLALVAGTLAILALAICVSAVLAAACAFGIVVFVNQKLQESINLFIECSAGIPPVVVGLCGLTILVPLFARYFATGFGVLSAAIVLAVLLLPAMICHWRLIVQKEYEEKILIATSLGIGNSTLIRKILWPAFRSYFWQSLVIYAERGMAETLAIVMVAGNVVQVPHSLFDPVRTLNSTIALEIPYAEGTHRSALFFLAIVVFALALALSVSTFAAKSLRSMLESRLQGSAHSKADRT